ncbi:MAG: hypothetical protein WCD04_16730, partial [Terriglobia bacterium]
VQHIATEKMAQLEGRSVKAQLRDLERRKILWLTDPEDNRRKLWPVSEMSPTAYQAWMNAETCTALQNINGQPDGTIAPGAVVATSALGQGLLPFALPSQKERTLVEAVPPAIPERFRAYIERWASILGDCTNGTWKRSLGQCLAGIPIQSRGDFIRATAKLQSIGVSTIHQKLNLLNEVNHNPDIPARQKMAEFWSRILPKNRPGRAGHSFFSDPENAWMREKLLSFYLTEAKHSVRDAYRLLLVEIDAKQKAWGAAKIYQRPTLHQCRTVLKDVDSPTFIFAREGEEAYRNCCEMSLSRNPDSLRADDLWVTDQRVSNVILQDAGHQLGRIWKVNDLDVASFRWLGCAFGPVLDSDMVMTAHTRAIAKDGHLPGAIHHDQGLEFKCTAFNGSFRAISRQALYREATGLWERLGVTPVGAIGGNPQSKTIERWHAEVDKFDKRFLTWCGGNTDERPEELSAIIEQHKAYCFRGEGKNPGIPTIEEYIVNFVDWCEKEWNARHHGKGKYLRGMTPDQAYYAKRRPEGFRLISLEELEEKSAEHRTVTVRRGGQVNLTFWGVQIEYIAPELFQFAGAQPPVEVEVITSRCDLSAVTVLYPVPGGQESCIAGIKSQMDWLPKGEEAREKLRAAMRARNHARRAVKEGIKAHQQLADAENPIALLEIQQGLPPNEKLAGQKTFGTPTLQPPPLGHPEIGSVEWMATHRSRTASAVASRFMEEEQ